MTATERSHQGCRKNFRLLSLFLGAVCALSPAASLRADGLAPQVTEDFIQTRHDRVPRFCRAPTVTASASGDWSNAATWSTNSVPGSNARVLIPAGITVVYDVASDQGVSCIEIGDRGVLRWAPNQETRLRVVNIQVLPGGRLVVGEKRARVSTGSAEIIFRDRPLDLNADPAQYGNGLHVFGAITVHGHRLARTFLRLSEEAGVGDTLVELERPARGWRAGDRLVIPDTRQIPFRKNLQYVSQAEELSVESMAGNGVGLATPLLYDHHGPRNATGQVGAVELAMLPHVGNLTRSVVFRSVDLTESSKVRYCQGPENLSGTNSCVTRGHVMLHARATVDIQYAAFQNLGRTIVDALDSTTFDEDGTPQNIGTNQVGRYSVHVHRLAGPRNRRNRGFQYRFVGNAIEGLLKWGLVLHEAHYGLVKDNVLYDGVGSAVATEDGMESFNVITRNFIVHTKVGDTEEILESTGRAGVESGRRRFGFTRDGFWFSGMNNYVRDNVVANAPDFAYNYNGYYLTQQQPIPKFRGADPETDSTEQTALPVLQSFRNEAYGATGQGLWLTWSRGCCRVDTYDKVSLFNRFKIWHVNNAAVETYHDNRNTFQAFTLRNDPSVSEQSEGGSLRFNRAFHLANRSYENGQTILRRLDVQGFNVGIQLPLKPEDETGEPNVTLVKDSFLHNYVNIQERLPNIGEKVTRIRNVRFEPLDIAPIRGLPDQPTAIEMVYEIHERTNLVDRSARTFVEEFNGDKSLNFELFFVEQAPSYPIPPPPDIDHVKFMACPEANLTNQLCFERHGVAISGHVAPCIEQGDDSSCSAAQTRAEELGIHGLVIE